MSQGSHSFVAMFFKTFSQLFPTIHMYFPNYVNCKIAHVLIRYIHVYYMVDYDEMYDNNYSKTKFYFRNLPVCRAYIVRY